MKSMDEIRKLPRTIIEQESMDGFGAMVQLLSTGKNRMATVQGSWGCWWDHISVSFTNRTPTWDEMAEVKKMFFRPDEVCFQIHPAEDDYVNYHPYCLHIWRPQVETFPTPPYWMVGPLKGQSMMDIQRIAAEEYAKWEAQYRAKS